MRIKTRAAAKKSRQRVEFPDYLRQFRRECRAALADAYIKRLLAAQKPPLRAAQITPELIALKREQLEVERLKRELRQSLVNQKEQS